MKFKIKEAFQVQDEVTIGSHSESADMGNPNGYCYGFRNFICAVTESGRRFIHGSFVTELGDEARAERFAAKVMLAGVIDDEHWSETYEVYGSPAWQSADDVRAYEHNLDPSRRGTVRDF